MEFGGNKTICLKNKIEFSNKKTTINYHQVKK